MSRSRRKGRCGRGCGVCKHAGEAKVKRQRDHERTDAREPDEIADLLIEASYAGFYED